MFYEYRNGPHRIVVGGQPGSWAVVKIDGEMCGGLNLPRGRTRPNAIALSAAHLRESISRCAHIGALADIVAAERRALEALTF